jgi:ATP:ADP antiporter, AAA family
VAESGSATAAERPGGTIVDAAARAIHARPGELKAVLLSFAYFFFLLSSYYILRPLRDEMGVAGGVQKLPWLFTGTFLAMLAAVPAFSALAARVPRHRFIPLSYRFFTANIVLFWALFATGTFRVGSARAFFIWTSVYNLFVVSVFWSFMADIFRHEQGTRLYGFIAAGGSVGALAGPLLTTLLVKPLGPTNLLLVSALLLEATVQCVRALHRWSTVERRDERRERVAEQPLGGSFISGIRVVFQSRFLLLICAYVLLLTATATFLYLEQAQIVAHASTDPRVRTALFARIDLVVNVLTLLIQGFITGRLLRRWGVGVGLALLPILTVGGFVALAALPTVFVITVVQGIRRAAHFAIERPAREILFIEVPREQKYKSKNFIDTVVYRGGDAITAWTSSALQALGLGIVPISALAVALSGVWLWNSISLARKDEAAAS